jgi:hypothetical protein
MMLSGFGFRISVAALLRLTPVTKAGGKWLDLKKSPVGSHPERSRF